MMRERRGLCPALQEVAGDRELLQREAEREPLSCGSNAVGERRGMGHWGQASKGRVGNRGQEEKEIGDLGGTWAGKEGQCRKAWAGDMGQWSAWAGKEWQGKRARAGGVGHCGAHGPAKEGQGSKVRAEGLGSAEWKGRVGKRGQPCGPPP
jgi:hypothetical protein